MLAHMTFRVRDIEKTKMFYQECLQPLGYVIAYEAFHGQHFLGFGCEVEEGDEALKIDTWFVDGISPYGDHPYTTGAHLCWVAQSRSAVDAFYQAALKMGGRDNRPPGLRPQYHPKYYGAFVIDLDGNNIEAVCHQ